MKGMAVGVRGVHRQNGHHPPVCLHQVGPPPPPFLPTMAGAAACSVKAWQGVVQQCKGSGRQVQVPISICLTESVGVNGMVAGEGVATPRMAGRRHVRAVCRHIQAVGKAER